MTNTTNTTAQPAPVSRAAAGLTTTERDMLRYALELAQDQMHSRGGEFTDDDQAAVDKLRRMADEAQPFTAEELAAAQADVDALDAEFPDEVDEMAASLARDGFGDDEITTILNTPPRRRLTPSEYSAAWHAVEGSAGEDGADPATILNSVLARLCIDGPESAADEAQQPETQCTRCGHGKGEHNVSGCLECPGGWKADHRFTPKRPPMDPVHILGIDAGSDEAQQPVPTPCSQPNPCEDGEICGVHQLAAGVPIDQIQVTS